MAGRQTGAVEEAPAEMRFKFNIGTEELREIIGWLNKKPFELNFTLVSFDELGANESLELVNSIFAKLDKKHDIKLKDEGPEKTLERFIEFLRILDYPGKFDDDVVKNFMNGDKKVLHPIIYFCLANFEQLIKRAYLGKFLVPIAVPDEYMADEEVKKSHQDYLALIEEFKENHKIYDEKTKAANPATLRKEIAQYEHEKELLSQKIKDFKEKFEGKADFQAILKEITLMRKEQEDESNLMDKLRQQKRLLDKCDEDLLQAREKHYESKRAVGDEATGDEMLFALRQEVARTRNKINEVQFEVREKRKKMQELEIKLYEAIPPADQVDQMKNRVSALRNMISDLERKIAQNKSSDKEDKMFIQRQQEQMVKSQRDQKEAEMKKLENEKNDLEDRIREKTKDLEKLKGPGYAKRTEIGKYQDSYNEKKSKQVKMESELNELKAENTTLRETLAILHDTKIETDKKVRRYEKQYGVEGLAKYTIGINDIIDTNAQVDEMKGKTLAEMSLIVQQLQGKIEELKVVIQPLAQEHKTLKNQVAQLEPQYKEEKAVFDGVTADAKSALDESREAYQAEKSEVYGMDSKIDILNYQTKVVKVMQEM
jgi:intraflagellar transport protein 81